MKTFKISHLSDLHLTSNPSARRSELKWGRLSGMNDAFRHVLTSKVVQNSQLIVVTGDVTDRGDIKAWSWFVKSLTDAGVKSRTLAITGNHDLCSLGARIGSRSKLKRSDLERASNGLLLAGQPGKFPWARVVDPNVVIFALDTNNSGNRTALSNAVGRIGEQQMQRFSELLAKHIRIPVKIVAIHHSPNIPEKATAIRRGQRPKSHFDRRTHQIPQNERREFRRLCVAGKIRLVIHGHLHEAEDRRVNGLRIIGAPATTEPLNMSNQDRQYQIYQYTVRGNGSRVNVELVTV